MNEKLYTLNGEHPVEGDVQSLFTENERATALAIAKDWLAKGWKPFLFGKTYDGEFNVILNYRNQKQKRQYKQAA